jgi:segregation and condensation protein B
MNEFDNEVKEESEDDFKEEEKVTSEDLPDKLSNSEEENKELDEYIEEEIPSEDLPDILSDSEEENEELDEYIKEKIPSEDLPDILNDSEEENEELDEYREEEVVEELITLGENDTISKISEDIVDNEVFETEEDKKKSFEAQMRELHRNLIEASLYAAGRPLTIEELSNRLEFPKKEVEELINEVAFDYLDRSTALVIAQIGDRYQMQIKPEYTEKVSKFAKGGAIAERYLRTLTIIALKQPILKSMVVKLRGTGAYEHVKYLIDNGFINAIKKGRSHELTTTDKYADMFGLPKSIQQLKQAMVTQLGIDESSIEQTEVEIREHPLSEPEIEIREQLPSESEVESEQEKEE